MKKVSDRITALETLIPAIHEKLKSLDEKMDGLDHIVRGNGTPGLAAKVENLTSFHRRWRDVFFAVLGGVVIGVTVSMFTSWSHRHAKQQDMPQMQQKP